MKVFAAFFLFFLPGIAAAGICERLLVAPSVVFRWALPTPLSLVEYEEAKKKITKVSQDESQDPDRFVNAFLDLADDGRSADIHTFLAWLVMIDPEIEPYVLDLVKKKTRLCLPRGWTWRAFLSPYFSDHVILAERLSKLSRAVLERSSIDKSKWWREAVNPLQFVRNRVTESTHHSRFIQRLIKWMNQHELEHVLRSTAYNSGHFDYRAEYNQRELFTHDARAAQWVGRTLLSILSIPAIADTANDVWTLRRQERLMDEQIQQMEERTHEYDRINDVVDPALRILEGKLKGG